LKHLTIQLLDCCGCLFEFAHSWRMTTMKERRHNRVMGAMMSLAGVLMAILPVVTWPNSVLFGALLSPGIPMGVNPLQPRPLGLHRPDRQKAIS
jgi:hypothetical protein